MSNVLGFGKSQTKEEQKVFNTFPVSACVDNVEITDAQYVYDGNWEAIEITYSRDGATLRDRMFFPRRENCNPRHWIDGDTAQDAYEDQMAIFNSQLLHIATKLGLVRKTLEESVSTIDNESYAKDYCDLINDNKGGIKLYCKTIRDSNGYVKISRKTSNTVPFLQEMDGECKLAYTNTEKKQLEASPSNQNGVVKQSWTHENV